MAREVKASIYTGAEVGPAKVIEGIPGTVGWRKLAYEIAVREVGDESKITKILLEFTG